MSVEIVGVGLLFERPLPHGPGAQRRVADVRGEVDALREALDGVEVLGERLETPVDAGGERGRIDVLRAFEVANDERVLGRHAPVRA